jgi:hypothetical protein
MPEIDRFVLGLSRNYEVAALILTVVRPKNALVLVTSETRDLFHRIEENLASEKITVTPLEIDLDNIASALPEITSHLLETSDAKPSAVEITGGTKTMTALLIVAALRANSRIFYLKHRTENRRPVVGGEILTWLDWITAKPEETGHYHGSSNEYERNYSHE